MVRLVDKIGDHVDVSVLESTSLVSILTRAYIANRDGDIQFTVTPTQARQLSRALNRRAKEAEEARVQSGQVPYPYIRDERRAKK